MYIFNYVYSMYLITLQCLCIRCMNCKRYFLITYHLHTFYGRSIIRFKTTLFGGTMAISNQPQNADRGSLGTLFVEGGCDYQFNDYNTQSTCNYTNTCNDTTTTTPLSTTAAPTTTPTNNPTISPTDRPTDKPTTSPIK